MGFRSVFRALQDVFPQVDIRLLRAAAIEHSKDADAAVEFILLEVLPSICNPAEAHGPAADHPTVSRPLEEVSQTASDQLDIGCPVGLEVQSPLLDKREAGEAENGSPSPKSISVVGDGDDISHPMEIANNNITCSNEALAGLSIANVQDLNSSDHQVQSSEAYLRGKQQLLNSASYHEDSTCLNEAQAGSTIVNVLDLNSSSHLDESFEAGLKEMREFFNGRSHQGSFAGSSSKVHEDISSSKYVTIQDLNEPTAQDSGSFIYNDLLAKSDSNGISKEVVIALPICLHDTSSIYEDTLDFAEVTTKTEIESSLNLNKEPCSRASSENGTEQVGFDDQMLGLEESSYETVPRSGDVCRIDLLEDAISDARNNKMQKTLFTSMESVICMMREVEQQEKAADQAKEEALKGGLDILVKAEEIKQMLEHAKEANDMHAGEVYGEKSILATEARELQSRLLNLSDERDKSLAILDQMRTALEARLVAADEVIKAAMQEKFEKEESSRKALAEQEFIMDKVLEESKRFQREAEENSKLRDFLMDRGHVVDILQGEIAVICQDVKSLKENFDSQVPLSKSLSSSQTSCLLASSSSSGKLLASDLVLDQDGSLVLTTKWTRSTSSVDGASKRTSPTSSVEGALQSNRSDRKSLTVDGWPVDGASQSNQSDRNALTDDGWPVDGASQSNRSDRKSLMDDGWEFFDKETEVYTDA